MMGSRRWIRSIALILILALPLSAAGSEERDALSLSIAASLQDGACLGLGLVSGGNRARVELNADAWGASLLLPWLALGSLEPVGLAAFIQRPQGLSYRLGRYEARPFSAPAPLEAPLLGLVAGGEGGCFSVDAKAEGVASWSGAWLSPRGLPLSAFTAWAFLPEESGDGSWDDPPSPASERSWHALGGALRLGPWRSAFGAGAMLSSPGEDAWALRWENLLSIRPFAFESVASLCAGSWRGPSGSLAPAFFIDARLSARARKFRVSLDYDETRSGWHEPPTRAVMLAGTADAGFALLEASVEALFRASVAALERELRWKATPLIAPWLSAYGSWELAGAEPARLEFGCSLKAGKTHALSLDALWRADTEGRYLKAGCAYAFGFSRGRLLLYLKTDGWLRYGVARPAADPAALINAGLRYSQNFP